MNIVTIENLAFAYRKAKVDLFYSGNPRRIDLLEFEKELEKNLNAIKKAYENNDESFFLNISNGYWYYPKSTISSSKKNNNILIISDSNGKGKSCRIKSYEVRVLERLPIAFHVITTLWIDSVGTKMDSMLSKSSYGNRIKQNKRRFSLGTFFPYPSCYRKWRGDAIESIRAALNKKKNVIAITTDFSAFYHSINPGFILEPAFQKKLGLCLNDEQKRFTRLIIRMLDRWAETTPLKRGLPVGCSISSVIANLALAFFDQSVEKNLKPLFYGRYVDDIILAIENTNGLSRQKDIWSWIQNRILCLSERYPDSMYPAFPHHDYTSKDHIINKKNMRNKILYLDYGKEYQELEKIDFGYLVFKKEKTKFFVLDYQSGTTFLDLLEKQIKEMSSEWRLLPELPEDQHIPSMLLSVSTRTGEDSDTLRSSDSISMRRAMFSIKMRDFESYCRDLSPKSWEKQRHAFLKTIYLYFTSPDVFFEYIRFFSYLFLKKDAFPPSIIQIKQFLH